MVATTVVINPNASQARDERTRDDLVRQLEDVLTQRDGVPPHIHVTTAPEDTAPLVRSALADGVQTVVGVGGDGTLRDVAAVLAGSGATLGVVPAGTGNQVAAVLGIPLSLQQAAAGLASEHARTIDLGEVTIRRAGVPDTTSVFIIGCGAGFDAQLMATTPSDWKRRIGKSAYLAQAVRLGMGIKAVPHTLTIDGEVIRTEASIAVVVNMGQPLPGVIDMRLPVDPSDGVFDLIVVGARGPLHGLRGLADQLLRTEFGGGHGAESIRRQGRAITIETEEPAPLQVDGDYVGDGTLSVRIMPAALDVLVPGMG